MRLRTISSLVLSTVLLTACAEDLTLVTQAWTALSGVWGKAIGDAGSAGADLASKAASIKLMAGDAAGAALKGKFDAAVGDHMKAVGDMKAVLANTKTAVEKAMMDKKIAPVQKALDDGKTAWDALAGKLPALATAAAGSLDALKKHADEAAAAAAAAPAGAGKEDATTDATAIKTAGGTASFPFTFKDDGSFDDKLNADVLARFLKFMNTCEVMKIDLSGMAKDDATGKKRADLAKKFVEKRGVPGSRVGATAGKAGGDGLMAKVIKPCP